MRPFHYLGFFGVVLWAFVILIIGCEKPNTPPVADFTFNPLTGNADTVFTFDASGSRDDEDEAQTLQFRWDWTNDGTWDTGFSSVSIISHQFSELRDFTIVMEVRDHKGLVSTRKKAIRIAPSLPVVKTLTIETVTDRSVKIQGEIIRDGGSPVTACGACWSTHGIPTVNDFTISGAERTGTFYVTAENLVPGMTYHIRAYAINSKGVTYGDQMTFPTPGLAVIRTNPVLNITITTAATGGEIVSDGGSPVRYKGVCWSNIKAPDLNDPRTMDGNGSENFASLLRNLKPGTNYYARAYAINSVGVSYGSVQTFKTVSTVPSLQCEAISEITRTTAKITCNITFGGGEDILERGICWSLNPNPTLADAKSVSNTPWAYFEGQLTGLEPGRSYHTRGYAINKVGTGYTNDIPIQTNPPVRATVSTSGISKITSSTAEGGGDVSDDGGLPVTARGVCWNTLQSPTINDAHTTDGSGNGFFPSSLTQLSANTTYYIRAYAVNAKGTSYGNQLMFKTLK